MAFEELNYLVSASTEIINSYGKITIAENEKIMVGNVELPKVYVGEQLISGDFTIVNDIAEKMNCLSTFMQIVPEGLIRISTSLQDSNGNRMIGTLMDNTHPICISIKKNIKEVGRAWVINDFYETIDIPLHDKEGNLVLGLGLGYKETKGERSILLFYLGDYVYSLNIMYIHEIIRVPEDVIKNSGDNHNLLGLISHHGELIPLIDTLKVCTIEKQNKSSEEYKQQKILVVIIDAKKYGILIDKVIGLANYDMKEIQLLNLSGIDQTSSELVCGVLPKVKGYSNVVVFYADKLVKLAMEMKLDS